ncbi:MAG TPA: hypothetical protein VF796_17760, partial [Humisphaera sp.]
MAVVALAGLADDALRPSDVLPLFDVGGGPEDEGRRLLRETARWVAARKLGWGQALAPMVRRWLADVPADADARGYLAWEVAQLAGSPEVAAALASTVRVPATPAARDVALRAMAEARPSAASAAWLDAVSAVAADAADRPAVNRLVETARALPKPKGGHGELTAAMTALARRADLPATVRLDALSAVGTLQPVDADVFRELVGLIGADAPADTRGRAAAVLAGARLSAAQQAELADALAGVGPLELAKLLPAFERGGAAEPLGRRLVAALRASPGRTSLRSEVLKPVLARFPQSVRDAAADLLKPDASAAEQAVALDKLLAELPAGDVNRGQAVFVGKRAACITCHATGYLGGKLGPDLTGIGKVRTDRDLLEAIVHPSASFVRGYDPVIVILKDGDKLPGIVTSEARDAIVLATGPQETKRVPRADVAEVRPGTVSLMP